MVLDEINESIVTNRISIISEMLTTLRELPIDDKTRFFDNKHNTAAAESYIRRSLEALFDLGRHILTKKFGVPAAEYKEISRGLFQKNIISENESELMRKMAGYRNRMVHFYHEISSEEIYDICLNHLNEVELILNILIAWINENKQNNSAR
ncbi:MAG: hypothetical protein A2161_17415 [Candidatus Schekmanbacteria bacterium RBG_13_48_7]|uniref:DUF86 domain-containing protein n=1 Tax=Candidatus Schekmanbacteria bacterium RBG_13_48_7 TaxID=1817878 RepID=A0A1F7S5H6_9BACT|nr:MAG: hypothetical protein A2161_17415 [Candidatus Schekmanbacteria bacterium RBG_13_48_7]